MSSDKCHAVSVQSEIQRIVCLRNFLKGQKRRVAECSKVEIVEYKSQFCSSIVLFVCFLHQGNTLNYKFTLV